MIFKEQQLLKNIRRESDGFVAMMSVLLVGAITLLLAIGAVSRSLDASDVALASESSYQALFLAESCVEHALSILASDPEYGGNEQFAVGDAHCQIGEVSATSSSRSFTTEATVGHFQKRLSVVGEVAASSSKVIDWEETVPL